MFRTIKFYAKLAGSLMMLTFKLPRIKKIREQEGERLADEAVCKIVTKWAAARVKDTGANVVVHGRENIPRDRNVVLMGNHQSNLDFAMLLAEMDVPVGFLAKIELKKTPYFNVWMAQMKCPLIDREDMKQQVKVIIDTINLVKNGHSLVIFPEGTRSRDGKMKEFKAGSFKIPIKAKVPIVPFTIIGAADVIENNNYHIKPATVHVYYHPPIDVENMPKEDMGKLHSMVQEIVEQPLKDFQG